MTAPPSLVERLRRFLTHDVWHAELSSLSGLRQLAVRSIRIGQLVIRGFREDDLFMHASALTFTMLVSLVPLLAIAFSVLKGLGAGEEASARLMAALASMPEQLQAFVKQILDIVNRTNFVALGWIGVIILFVTVVQVLSSMETSFNRVWGVRSGRGLWQQFTNYTSITVVVPVLIMAAFAISASLHTRAVAAHLGQAAFVYRTLLRLAPLFTVWLAFFFLFVFMPNTRVDRRSAAVSAFVAALLWILWQKIYVALQVGVARYNAIYGTFASVPIFLMWLYMSWVIILLGSELAFALQNHGTYHMERSAALASARARIALALAVMTEAARALLQGQPAFCAATYAAERKVPVRLVNDVVGILSAGGLLAGLADRPGCHALLRAPESVPIAAIIDLVLRQGSGRDDLGLHQLDPAVERLLGNMDDNLQRAIAPATLRDLVAPAA